nr:MAG TPA: Sporulation protein Cse60 [Caudoviricetes sp.]
MRVKCFQADSAESLERKITEWIDSYRGNLNLLDVKYSVSISAIGERGGSYIIHGALAQYQ